MNVAGNATEESGVFYTDWQLGVAETEPQSDRRPSRDSSRSDSVEVAVAVLPAGDYGSTQLTKIDRVAGQLSELVESVDASYLVVDLSRVRFGAMFLGMLVTVTNRAHKVGKTLIVLGDRLGLVRLSKLDRLIPTFDELDDLLVAERARRE